jgi:alkyl sulfatase BDS1-like metallo-beta-lactamase superfamily hydrolase
VDELMREVQLPDELAVGEGYGKVAWGVRAIWEGYAGWFHARSTTELYPAPAVGVGPELVAMAGGADAVVRAATGRVDAGDGLGAVQLCELALAAEPEHRAARKVFVAAHELLLAEHEALPAEQVNFWLVGWLRHQIATTRAALDEAGA